MRHTAPTTLTTTLRLVDRTLPPTSRLKSAPWDPADPAVPPDPQDPKEQWELVVNPVTPAPLDPTETEVPPDPQDPLALREMLVETEKLDLTDSLDLGAPTEPQVCPDFQDTKVTVDSTDSLANAETRGNPVKLVRLETPDPQDL